MFWEVTIAVKINELEPQKNSHRGAIKEITIDSNQIPLFLIPGAFSNWAEMLLFGTALHIASGGRRPVFIYVDERTLNGNLEASHYKSTLEEAEKIADEINGALNGTTNPCLIAGYSYGATLAGMTAQLLQDKFETHVFLLDGASPEVMRKHLSQNAKPILDLIDLVKHAAKLSELENGIEENETLLNKLLHQSLATRIQILKEATLTAASQNANLVDQMDRFSKHMAICEEHLKNLLIPYSQTITDKVHATALVAQKTSDKFNDKSAGWDSVFTDLKFIDNQALIESNHQALLNETNSQLLANYIQHYVQDRFDATYLDNALKRLTAQASLKIAQLKLNVQGHSGTSPTRSPQTLTPRSQFTDEASDTGSPRSTHSRTSSDDFSTSDPIAFVTPPDSLAGSPSINPSALFSHNNANASRNTAAHLSPTRRF